MTTWILVLFLHTKSHSAMTSVVFHTEQACQSALEIWRKRPAITATFDGYCFEDKADYPHDQQQ